MNNIINISKSLVKLDITTIDKFNINNILNKESINSNDTAILYSFLKKYKDKIFLYLKIPFSSIEQPNNFIDNTADVLFSVEGKYIYIRLNNFINKNIYFELSDLLYTYNFKHNKENKEWRHVYNESIVYNILQNKIFKNISHSILNIDLKNAIETIRNNRETSFINSSKKEIDVVIPDFLKDKLYPFQKVPIEYIKNKQHLFLTDEMGSGKSIQSLGVVEVYNLYPVIILCPANLKLNWVKEINKWFGDTKKIQVVYGRKSKIESERDFYIINYDIITYYKLEQFGNINAVIGDESHKIKNGKIKSTKHILEQFKNVKYKILLTGTPILNNPIELKSQLQFLNVLKYFGGATAFTNRYCNPQKNQWGYYTYGSSNEEELQERLREICMVRRLKKDILPELPDKIYQEIYIELENIKLYRDIESNIKKWYFQKKAFELDATQNEKDDIQRIISEMKLDDNDDVSALAKIEYLKQAVAFFKLPYVYDWIDNTLLQKNKIVIYAHHRNIIEAIHENYKHNSVYLMGGMQKESQNVINKFYNDPNINIFIGSIGAAGVGIDLTCSDTIGFVEYAWSDAIMEQVADRLHRIGQKDVVNIYRFLTLDTIEIEIFNLILRKKEMFEKITKVDLIKKLFNSLK